MNAFRSAAIRPLIFAVALLPAGGTSAHAQDRKPLVWAADAEGGAPYVFVDPEAPGGIRGFEKDIVDALASALGRPIEFKQYDFKNLTLGLKSGDFDFAMNGLELTADRRADIQLRFSKPYYAFKLQLVFRADDDRLQTLEDCKNAPEVKIGTLENTAASRLLAAMGFVKDKQYIEFESQVTPYQKLSDGTLDAVLMDLPIALEYANPAKHPKLRWAQQPEFGRGYYVIAFRAADKELADEIDAALDQLWKDGTLVRIYRKWDLWNANQEEFLPDGVFGDIRYAAELQERRDWSVGAYLPLLLGGAVETVKLTALSFLVAIVVGMPIALCRLYGPPPVRALATLYIEFFRGIPVLLLLYFLYFGLPAMVASMGGELRLPPELVAVLGLGLTYSAYEAEIYRAGVLSVPEGQWEAAASLGMSPLLTFRRIILPQAMRVILPPSTSDLVALFKDTSIVSVITLVELSKQYQILATSGSDYWTIGEIGLATAALYLVMSVPLGYLSRYLEARWAKSSS